MANKKQKMYDEFAHVIKVATSCTKDCHVPAAVNHLHNFAIRHNITKDNKKTSYLFKCTVNLAFYLEDTYQHCLCGEHYSTPNNKTVQKTYPNINDYMSKLLGFKINQFVAR